MHKIDPESTKNILLKDSNRVLENTLRNYDINGFAIYFEVGQENPVFYYAINTKDNGTAGPDTGDWDYPAEGFEGSEPSKSWKNEYKKLDDYMSATHQEYEIHELFVECMSKLRQNWFQKLPDCIFTVNGCDDDEETIIKTFNKINAPTQKL